MTDLQRFAPEEHSTAEPTQPRVAGLVRMLRVFTLVVIGIVAVTICVVPWGLAIWFIGHLFGAW